MALDTVYLEIARRLGVRPAELERAREAQGLAARADRMRGALEALATATERLPALARMALEEPHMTGSDIAQALGLANYQDPVSVALKALDSLAMASELPQRPVARPAAAPTKPRVRSAPGGGVCAEDLAALLRDGGPATMRELEARIGRKISGGAFASGRRRGLLRQLDDGRWEVVA